MKAAAELMALWQQAFWVVAIVFLRVAALTSLLPGFGEQFIPARIRLAIALAFTALVSPAVGGNLPTTLSLSEFGWLAITETLAGLILGIGLRLFVFALQIAGSMAAQATSLSQLFGQTGMDPMPGIGHVLVISGLALAVTAGLHVRITEMLIQSYDYLPVGKLPLANDLSYWGIMRVAQTFGLAFRLAAPFLIASALYNLALGVINRAMPQLMVAFVGAPLITAGGLGILFLIAIPILELWHTLLTAFIAAPLGSAP